MASLPASAALAEARSGVDMPENGRPVAQEPRPYGTQVLLGAGPAYPHPYSRRPYDRGDPNGVVYVGGPGPDWHGAKVLWLVSPSYHGAIVVRGRQLDGTGLLRFADEEPDGSSRLLASLRLPASPGWLRNGWRDRPSTELFSGPGCYGFQVDGRNFSRTIVLEVALD
jgi:hypothetical protein